MSSFMSLYSLGLIFAAMTLGYVLILFMFILMFEHVRSLWWKEVAKRLAKKELDDMAFINSMRNHPAGGKNLREQLRQ